MSEQLWQMLTSIAFPIIAMIVGGGIATFWTPGPKLRSAIQHFAAGVVFAVVAGELLPEMRRQHAPTPVVFGFALGVAVVLGVRWVLERHGAAAEGMEERPAGLIVAVGVDILLDGLLVEIAFAAGEREGLLLTLALTIEVLFLGLSTAVALGKARTLPGKTSAIIAALALLIALGATIGVVTLAGLGGTGLTAMLSFGAAALLYLVTEELLVEAHALPVTPPITAMFFAGFLLLLISEMMGVV